MLDKHAIMNKLSEGASRLKEVNKRASEMRASLVAEGGDTIKPPATSGGTPPLQGSNSQGLNKS